MQKKKEKPCEKKNLGFPWLPSANKKEKNLLIFFTFSI